MSHAPAGWPNNWNIWCVLHTQWCGPSWAGGCISQSPARKAEPAQAGTELCCSKQPWEGDALAVQSLGLFMFLGQNGNPDFAESETIWILISSQSQILLGLLLPAQHTQQVPKFTLWQWTPHLLNSKGCVADQEYPDLLALRPMDSLMPPKFRILTVSIRYIWLPGQLFIVAENNSNPSVSFHLFSHCPC